MEPYILIIEDEPGIVELLDYNLKAAGFETAVAHDGDEAELALSERTPDAVLLDWMLPGVSGIELCRRIRKRPETRSLPVIMLTAREDEASRVTGLEMGADDYVTKPFSGRELVARVRAVLRRVQGAEDPGGPLRAGMAELDPISRTCRVDGSVVDLTRLEFDLLAELAAHPNVVFTRERLLERVWGYQSGVGGKTVDVHVANLRRKLGKDLPIVAVRGVGYRLDPSAA